MADLEPTFYDIHDLKEIGMDQVDVVRAIYNLWKAVAAICNNIDEDGGVLGTDYLSKIGTDLNTAMAKCKAPHGPTT